MTEPTFLTPAAHEKLRAELEHLTPAFARDASGDDDTIICVVNPLPYERTEVVERLVVFQPPGPDLSGLRLYDENGDIVPFNVVSKRYVERFWGVDYRLLLDTEEQLDRLSDRLASLTETDGGTSRTVRWTYLLTGELADKVYAAVDRLVPKERRRTSVEEIKEIFDLTRSEGVKACAYMIIGCPHEKTADEILDVIPFMHDLDPAYVVFDHHRKASVSALRRFLTVHGVLVAGRWAEWKYSAMEDAILDGFSVARRLAKKGDA